MKPMTIVYLCLLCLSGVLFLLAPKLAGFLLLLTLITWFIHGVFVSTADHRIG